MKLNLKNFLIHLLAWLFFLSVPILMFWNSGILNKIDNKYIPIMPSIITGLFLITLFYFNYYFLIPKFFFKGKYWLYSILCIICIVFLLNLPHLILSIFGQLPPIDTSSQAFKNDQSFKKTMPLVFTNILLLYIVAFFASIGLRINNQWKKTEKERLSAQLSYLKTQINPHFLFNTLNSIYSVTIGKAPQGAEMVEKLSEMMRYTLKEAQLDFVPLEKEINYITNYIDLQKVRFDKSVKFSFEINGDYNDKQIASLLLIPFVENAFKHGVNSEQDSNIKITIDIQENELHLQVFNNKVEIENDTEEKSGLGIQNTKHRLELIYPDNYTLNIKDTKKDFFVSLHIQLN